MDAELTIRRVCVEQAAWVWNCSAKAIAAAEGRRRRSFYGCFRGGNAA